MSELTQQAITPDPVTCETCRHRGVAEELDADGVRTVAGQRLGRFALRPGEMLGQQESSLAAVTVYSGMAARWRRDAAGDVLLALAFPGDFVDLRQDDRIRLEALTDLTYCGFDAAGRAGLLACPDLAHRMLIAEARWRRLAEERAAAFASRPAIGRLCHFLLSIHEALLTRGLADRTGFTFPIGRTMLAEALGLSGMHLRRLLGELQSDGTLGIGPGRRVRMVDQDAMRAHAGVSTDAARPAPLI